MNKINAKKLILSFILILFVFSFGVSILAAPGDDPTGTGEAEDDLEYRQDLIDQFSERISPLKGYDYDYDESLDSYIDSLSYYLDIDIEIEELYNKIDELVGQIYEEFSDLGRNHLEILKDDLGLDYSIIIEKYEEDILQSINDNEYIDFSMLRSVVEEDIREASKEAIEAKYPILQKDFDDIDENDISSLETIASDYSSFNILYSRYIIERSEEEGYSDLFIDDYLEKAKYEEEKNIVSNKILALLNVHDEEEVVSKVSMYVSSVSGFLYDRCYSDRDFYVIEKSEELDNFYNEGKDYVYLLQAKERFVNYFNDFYSEAELKENYTSENLIKVKKLIDDSFDLLPDLTLRSEVDNLRSELLSNINDIEKVVIETSKEYYNEDYQYRASVKGVTSATGNYSLNVYKNVAGVDWANKMYTITIMDDTYNVIEHFDSDVIITIYDDLDGIGDFDLFTFTDGVRKKVDYVYSDKKIVIKTKDISNIYLVKYEKTPYLAMILTFSSIAIVSVVGVIILKRRGLIV